jgi:hypothetical protein
MKRLIRKQADLVSTFTGAVEFLNHNPDLVNKIGEKVMKAIHLYEDYEKVESQVHAMLSSWKAYADKFMQKLTQSSDDMVEVINTDEVVDIQNAARIKRNRLLRTAEESANYNAQEIKETFDQSTLDGLLQSTNELLNFVQSNPPTNGEADLGELEELNGLVQDMISVAPQVQSQI